MTDRIGVFSTCSGLGGTERMAIELASGMRRLGRDVELYFPETPDSPRIWDWSREQGIEGKPHAGICRDYEAHSLDAMRALRNLVRERRFSEVHILYGGNFIPAKDILAIRLGGCRRVIPTVYQPIPFEPYTFRNRKCSATYIAAALSRHVVVACRAMVDHFRSIGVPSGKIAQIPCGSRVPETQLTKSDARSRLGWPDDSIIVGSLCRLEPYKGIHRLIESMATETSARLVVIGDGPERARLEALGQQTMGDRIAFLGRVPDVHAVLAALDIFALPSSLEGFGLVYTEAAFHRVPSIGTRTGGIPDAIEDGVTGLLVAPDDIGELRLALRRLIESPELRQTMGLAARERALREFTAERMVDRYLSLPR